MEGKEDMKDRPFNYLRLSFIAVERGKLNAPQSWPLKQSWLEREKPWKLLTYTVCKSQLLQRAQANTHSSTLTIHLRLRLKLK